MLYIAYYYAINLKVVGLAPGDEFLSAVILSRNVFTQITDVYAHKDNNNIGFQESL
jgi:hypothetical protein